MTEDSRATIPCSLNEQAEHESCYRPPGGNFSVHFTNFLHRCMIMPCFGEDEREVFHPTFLRFMHFALIDSTKKLLSLKKSLSHEVTVEEDELLEKLLRHCDFELDCKTGLALDRFNSEFPTFINKCGGSNPSENHESYIKIFSQGVMSEFEKLMRYKSALSRKNQNIQRMSNVVGSNSNIPNRTSSANDSIQGLEELRLNPSLLQLIADTKKHLIYSLYVSGEHIALKVLKSNLNTPDIKNIQTLDNELLIGGKVHHDAFRFSLARKAYKNKHALLLEWAYGYPISFSQPFGKVNDFLLIAREIVSALLAIHESRIIHMNLTCDHIILNPKLNTVKIIGCGSSTSVFKRKDYISNEELLEKDLRCISPEQTGRVNRDIDYRSDFYSLGAIFYKLLSGYYPFESEDPFTLIQKHILEEPTPVVRINPIVPCPISNMISQLLRKDADDRYQSAKGILFDIDFMISEYESDTQLRNVVLSQRDAQEILFIPQKLYGRSTQCRALLEAFNRACRSSFELVFIKGQSGTGKSALVLDLYEEVVRNNAFLCIGKCCETGRPHNAISQAIQNFCVDLYTRDETTFETFKAKIQEAVKDEGSLTNISSHLHLLLGQKPYIFESFGTEAKNRFHHVFIQFVKAICSGDFPVILVLEDLQWLDLDSLSAIHALIEASKSIKNLMVIGVYRENEICSELSDLLLKVKEMNINVKDIILENLDEDVTNDLVSDTLCVSKFETRSLTAWIHERTKGNPSLIKEVLRNLDAKGLIYLCEDTSRWMCNFVDHSMYQVNVDAHELLRQKFAALDHSSQQILRIASCLDSFSLQTLRSVWNDTKCVENALSSEFIIQCKRSNGNLFCFAHDQIQKSLFSSLSEDKDHLLCISIKLWKNLPNEELIENIYNIANLLLLAIDQNEPKRDLELATFFLQVASKAMESISFKLAFEYSEAGICAIGYNWKTNYDLSLELHYLAAKASYCLTNYTNMNLYVNVIFENVTSPIHLVSSYSLLIRRFNDEKKYEEALRIAMRILCLLDKNVCVDPPDSEIAIEIEKAKVLICGKTFEDIMDIGKTNDEYLLSVMMIFNDILHITISTNYKLYCYICTQMVIYSFYHGVSKYSSSGFLGFAQVLCRHGDKLAFQFGKLSLFIVERTNIKELAPGIYFGFYSSISPFFSSIHNSLKYLKKSFSIFLEIGSHDASLVCIDTFCCYAFLSGYSLKSLTDQIERFKCIIPCETKIIRAAHQHVLNLRNSSDNIIFSMLRSEILDHSSSQYCGSPFDIAGVCIQCLVLAYIFNDYDLAIKFSERCKPHMRYIASDFMYPVYLFYDALILIALCGEKERKQADWMPRVKDSLLKLKKMSENVPENYLNKVHLLEAEIAAVNGNTSEAANNYEQSILLSNAHSFPHEEAIANERAFLFFLREKSTEKASKFLVQSCEVFLSWGAAAKKDQLSTKYSSLCKGTLNRSIFSHLNSFSHDYVHVEENKSNASISQLTETSDFVTEMKYFHNC